MNAKLNWVTLQGLMKQVLSLLLGLPGIGQPLWDLCKCQASKPCVHGNGHYHHKPLHTSSRKHSRDIGKKVGGHTRVCTFET